MIWHTSYQMCVTHSSYVWYSALHTWYVMCMLHSFYAWFGALHTWCVKSVTHSFYMWCGTLHTWCVWHTRLMCDMAHFIDDTWCVWCACFMYIKRAIQNWFKIGLAHNSKLNYRTLYMMWWWVQKWWHLIAQKETYHHVKRDIWMKQERRTEKSAIWHFSYMMCVTHSEREREV